MTSPLRSQDRKNIMIPKYKISKWIAYITKLALPLAYLFVSFIMGYSYGESGVNRDSAAPLFLGMLWGFIFAVVGTSVGRLLSTLVDRRKTIRGQLLVLFIAILPLASIKGYFLWQKHKLDLQNKKITEDVASFNQRERAKYPPVKKTGKGVFPDYLSVTLDPEGGVRVTNRYQETLEVKLYLGSNSYQCKLSVVSEAQTSNPSHAPDPRQIPVWLSPGASAQLKFPTTGCPSPHALAEIGLLVYGQGWLIFNSIE
ncbi:MAG: hypothetical protein ACKOX6_01420 [Bdellovibrio sp.]